MSHQGVGLQLLAALLASLKERPLAGQPLALPPVAKGEEETVRACSQESITQHKG
jgi:hypothetical protein